MTAACVSAPERSATVQLQVLALNDFHGNLDPPSGGIRVIDESGALVSTPGGGAARVATLVAERRALAANSILVAAGDLIVQEAGGRVCDLQGERIRYNQRDTQVNGILASNGHLQQRALALVDRLPPQF